MSGGGTQTTTEQSSTTYPQWSQDAGQNTFQTGTGMLETFLRNPQYAVAGFNTDQMKAFDLARDTARTAFTTPAGTVPGSPNLNAALASSTAMTPAVAGPATQAATHQATAAQMAGAQAAGAQLSPSEIQAFLNPYTQNVVDTSLYNLRRERDRNQADIGARAAASGSFGGSREAVQRASLDRNFSEQAGTLAATLMAQGYDKATATAMANAQMRQQTDLTNAQLRQQTDTTNAQLRQQIALANASALNAGELANAGLRQNATEADAGRAQQAGITNATLGQQLALANAAAQNTMLTTGADYGLKAAQVNDQFRTNQQAREEAARMAILQGGNQQQQFGQTALDVPWTALERLFGLTPKQLNSQTISQKESPDNSASPLQTIIGAGTTLLGSKVAGGGTILSSLMGLSDEREKTNIKKVGKDPETGLDLYSYDYKDDVEAAKKSGKTMPPKRVGPMAQDIEKLDPRAVREIGGKKVVQQPPGGILGMLAA